MLVTYLWTLKFELHKIFICHKIFFFPFFNLFKNRKTILSSWASEQAMGWNWPTSHSLLTPDLRDMPVYKEKQRTKQKKDDYGKNRSPTSIFHLWPRDILNTSF